MSLGTILVVLLLLALCGVLPVWPHASNYGYGPGGIVVVVLVIVIVLMMTGKI